jgi:hypothetical protein
MSRRASAGGRRELGNTGMNRRYVRRRADGTFIESDDVGRAIAADSRTVTNTTKGRGPAERRKR